MSDASSQPGSQNQNPSGGIASSWFSPSNAGQQSASDTAPHSTAASGAPPAQNGDLPGNLIGRTSIALIAVIGVILVCAWALKRLGFQRDRAGQSLPIVASRSLGQRERVVVLEVEDEWLVLGVTPQYITALHRRPAPADRPSGRARDQASDRASPTSTAGKRPGFGQALAENMANLTGRGSR